MQKELSSKEMLGLLAGHFPNQEIRFDQNHFKITRLKVKVTYPFQGLRQDLLETLLSLTGEWDFLQSDFQYSGREGTIMVDYSIMPYDVEKFIKNVRYRGELINGGGDS